MAWARINDLIKNRRIPKPDHTTIWKRLAAEETTPTASSRDGVIAAVDTTGFSTTLRGEWMRDVWHKRRGFVKAHIMVDVLTLEILAVVVTDHTIGNNRVFAMLIDRALERGIVIRRILADGAYDTLANFDALHERGIEAGIKIDRRATMLSRGHSRARSRAVRERNSIGQEAWSERYEYSLRWMIEFVFSAIKRTLGSEVRSRRRDLMFSEVENKFWTWNEMRLEDLRN